MRREPIIDLVKAIQDEFKKWTLDYRKGVWNALTSKEGEKEMKDLILHPHRSIKSFRNLDFKEWLEDHI